jgi:hypothetical protein
VAKYRPGFLFAGKMGVKKMNTGKGTRRGRSLMSKLFLVMIFTSVISLAGQTKCFATNVSLQWDPETDPSVVGYNVYYQADSYTQPFNGTGATNGASPINVQNQTSATINGLDPSHAYYFAVTAYNASGVESSYSNIAILPELVPPTISLNSPANNANVSGAVSVTANASDNVGVAKVEFYVNGTLNATDISTPYIYSWDTSSVTVGTYTLMAKAYDAAGNVGQSTSVNVTVVKDTSAPTVSISAPTNNATVSGTMTVTADVSDNIGVSRVEFYENGVLRAAVNSSPYSYKWDTSASANGAYTISAKAYDAVGNVGQSVSVLITVNNIATAPVPLKGDVNGDSVVTVADALIVLRAALDSALQTQLVKSTGDVWPLNSSGKPQGEGIVDINDARLILQNAVGALTW